MTIDAVITWVDGNDPALSEKRARFCSADILKRDDIAGKERYEDSGELLWCLESINKFAPFFRRIFIVTDGQDPHVDAKLKAMFPLGYIPVEIVDHSVVFRGYEEYLPVFNSLAIETMLWRIPGLSEHFVYFNDDLMLASKVSPSDFFSESGEPVCYASLKAYALTRFSRLLKPSSGGRKTVTFKGMMVNASALAGEKFLYPKVHHTPKPHCKSFYEEFFASHPGSIERNIGHRFRDAEQYLPDLLEYASKRRILKRVSPFKVLFYIIPKNKPDYVKKKIAGFAHRKNVKFICNNSISRGSEEDRRQILSFVSGLLSQSGRESVFSSVCESRDNSPA